MTENRKPSHNALVVTNPNRRQNEKPWFEKVGAAWPTQDGKGFFVKLFAVPVNGEIVLKEQQDGDDTTSREEERRMQSGNYGHESRGR